MWLDAKLYERTNWHIRKSRSRSKTAAARVRTISTKTVCVIVLILNIPPIRINSYDTRFGKFIYSLTSAKIEPLPAITYSKILTRLISDLNDVILYHSNLTDDFQASRGHLGSIKNILRDQIFKPQQLNFFARLFQSKHDRQCQLEKKNKLHESLEALDYIDRTVQMAWNSTEQAISGTKSLVEMLRPCEGPVWDSEAWLITTPIEMIKEGWASLDEVYHVLVKTNDDAIRLILPLKRHSSS